MNEKGPGNDEYETPPWLFKSLDTEFAFTLDAAATQANAKVQLFNSKNTNLGWSDHIVFCNPPYSDIWPFVWMAHKRDAKAAVLLLPVRSDSSWWRMVLAADEIRWLRKRIRFELGGVAQESPRFASLIAIWRNP